MGRLLNPELGSLELEILRYLWAQKNADAKSIHHAIGKKKGITLNTIQSTVKRLFEKTYLTRKKVSHAHIYSPQLDLVEFNKNLLENIRDNVMAGETGAMFSAFVSLADDIGEDELKRLEQIIKNRLESSKEQAT